MIYRFDRFLRFAELTDWLQSLAAAHPGLVTLESYGRSHEGRHLWLLAITDTTTGAHHTKPAHWVDANIHAVEVTGGVAALYLAQHLVDGFGTDASVTEALRTRTFYIAPRVNPDGVEWTLADDPQFRRSSVRNWPWVDGHEDAGLHERDVDGDGRVLSMRILDAHGAWMASPDEPRLMVRVPAEGAPAGTARYRMLVEGVVVDHDGFTVPTPAPPQSLDLNRNFPAQWGTQVRGSGDHPLSEPEIDALVRTVVARPNICGYNAFHTSGGVLLRPSSTVADSGLPARDVWMWKELGRRCTELSTYPVHSVFEDFTWDKSNPMSGAADDWAYEHLGVFSWTTEFWDAVHAATGERSHTDNWYVGVTAEQELAVYRWVVQHHPEAYADWTPFEHPQLGSVEIGGWDDVFFWANAPASRLLDEVRPHAAFAVHQALCSPRVEVLKAAAVALGGDTWRIEVGIANTGWLPTDVTSRARREHLVLPLTATLSGAEVLDGRARLELGQLEGRSAARFQSGKNDGTPERVLATWVVRAPAGATVHVDVCHERAGAASVDITL